MVKRTGLWSGSEIVYNIKNAMKQLTYILAWIGAVTIISLNAFAEVRSADNEIIEQCLLQMKELDYVETIDNINPKFVVIPEKDEEITDGIASGGQAEPVLNESSIKDLEVSHQQLLTEVENYRKHIERIKKSEDPPDVRDWLQYTKKMKNYQNKKVDDSVNYAQQSKINLDSIREDASYIESLQRASELPVLEEEEALVLSNQINSEIAKQLLMLRHDQALKSRLEAVDHARAFMLQSESTEMSESTQKNNKNVLKMFTNLFKPKDENSNSDKGVFSLSQ